MKTPTKSSSVRRSSRRTQKRNYTVGDIVEIEHGGVSITGRLLSKATLDENAANPLWRALLMDAKGKEQTEKELYESSFGEVVGKHMEDIVEDEPKSTAAACTNNKRKESPPPPSPLVAETATIKLAEPETPLIFVSSQDTKQAKNKKLKSSDSSDSSLTPSSVNSKQQARASAREERVRRRQALMIRDKDDNDNDTVIIKHDSSSTSGSKHGAAMKKGNKQCHHKSADCITIPMLTGTLYLYHGVKRRAEFVRKV